MENVAGDKRLIADSQHNGGSRPLAGPEQGRQVPVSENATLPSRPRYEISAEKPGTKPR